MNCLYELRIVSRERGFIPAILVTTRAHRGDGGDLFDAILTMIGYYVIILTAAMVLIVAVVQVFKALSARRGHDKRVESSQVSDEAVEDAREEIAAAAIGAVSFMLGTEKPSGVSAWLHSERDVLSPWKVASRSRRIPYGGG